MGEDISINRNYAIDYFKGLLVIGMIYTHVLQFFSDPAIFDSVEIITQFFNLVTFSGFIFCFGYVNQLVYYRKSFANVYRRMLVASIKTLLAFYISGIAFQIFVANESLTWKTIYPVLLLEVIPGWSEFLLSFSMILFMGILLFPFIKWMIEKPSIFLIITGLLLISTKMDYGLIDTPQLGLLIGTDLFPTFPVIQYFPFYIIGIYFARYSIRFNWKILISSVIGTLIFLVFLIINHFQLPERFPPSIYWILGSTFFIYMYFLIVKWLEFHFNDISWLRKIGENALLFLILSNLSIFALVSSLTSWIVSPSNGFLITIFIISLVFYLINITKNSPRPES